MGGKGALGFRKCSSHDSVPKAFTKVFFYYSKTKVRTIYAIDETLVINLSSIIRFGRFEFLKSMSKISD